MQPPALDAFNRIPDLFEDFSKGVDSAKWIAAYLPHWTTPERAEARFATSDHGLELRIDADQPVWRPEDAPMRVSSLQTGNQSGPVGSTRGTHPHESGMSVRTHWPRTELWLPTAGRIDITVSASASAGCMLAAWFIGIGEPAEDAGEICLFEIDAPKSNGVWTARCGIKAHTDQRLHDEKVEVPLWFDAAKPHTWTLLWGDGATAIGCEGQVVAQFNQAPGYPLLLLVDLFELTEPAGDYPKTATVHEVRGWAD